MKQHNKDQSKGMNTAERLLCDAFLSMQTRAEVRDLLQDLCTPAELEAMVDRWRVTLMLQQGLTYRDINQRTGVSVTTIGRVARFMDFGSGGYKRALERIEVPQ